MSDKSKVKRPSRRTNGVGKKSMSSMREINEGVIGIFCADLHLTLNAPVWRSAEPDWLEAQARVLKEIFDLAEDYDCPVFIVGDMFDKAIVSTELSNWIYEHISIPNIYAIPGQHDLPNHQYDNIHKTGFRNLVNSNIIKEIKELSPIEFSNFIICGFPFDSEIVQLNYTTKKLKIAIIHEYIWTGNHHYPNAPDEAKLTGDKTQYIDRKWFGYDVIVYGDNHKGFMVGMGKTTVFNCGTLMRRKSDEINYKPQVGLLLESGKVVPHYLDISEDKYIESDEIPVETEEELDMSSFMQELERLGKTALDFMDAMKQFLHAGKTSDEAKQIILDAMEKKK